MPLLFSYGTLQEENVQLCTFGRLLHGQKDELVGFKQSFVKIRDPHLVTSTGKAHHANAAFNGRDDSRVSGTVFEITDAELTAADQYEQLADYQRIAATLASGKQVWVYVDARNAPMEILVRPPRAEDRAEWTRMRALLWPETAAATHDEEIAAFLTGNLTGWLAGLDAVAVFVAVRPAGGLCGFVEASVRPMADDCTTHPVGYLEGWYVDPDMRRKGVGRRLVAAAETWASAQGCREMASDARLANAISIAAHQALGFDREAPSIRFNKWLLPPAGQKNATTKGHHQLTLVPLPGAYAVCRLDAAAAFPDWLVGGSFFSVTRTTDELSIVCRQEDVPKGVQCESGWHCLRVAGILSFSLVGILASLLKPLADEGVSVFVVSTFDTDYLLVKEQDLPRAVEALHRAGHAVEPHTM
jgi:GNAT superfamily N-acetyltransferase/gamma-glutamylcyclotransferase (GGCT)/AIG2-like uncharacterized protein YtfP